MRNILVMSLFLIYQMKLTVLLLCYMLQTSFNGLLFGSQQSLSRRLKYDMLIQPVFSYLFPQYECTEHFNCSPVTAQISRYCLGVIALISYQYRLYSSIPLFIMTCNEECITYWLPHNYLYLKHRTSLYFIVCLFVLAKTIAIMSFRNVIKIDKLSCQQNKVANS